MPIVIVVGAAVVLLAHALIHLLGFVAYWPLAEIAGLPYKTTLFAGRLQLAPTATRLYSLLWLASALGFLAGVIGVLLRSELWLPLLTGAAVLSLAAIIPDWQLAFRGAWVDLALIAVLAAAFGLRVEPAPLPPLQGNTQPAASIPLPQDLPAPVARYYLQTVGDPFPVIDSAVLSMRGSVRVMGVTFPSRLRFTHDAGRGYRHYIEATIFGAPIMKINEWYLDGHARLELPFGVTENEPKVDSAANLGLWGESVWLPTVYLTDPRVRWEAVDESTATLVVPATDEEENFTVRFDPDTGLLQSMQALRFKDANSTERVPWRFDVLDWNTFSGLRLPARGTVTWLDEGSPWLVVKLEQVDYNVSVEEYIKTSGP